MFHLALPGSGKSKAAGISTTTTTETLVPTEVSNIHNIDDTTDSSLDALFEGDSPDFSSDQTDVENANVNGDINIDFSVFDSDYEDDLLIADNLLGFFSASIDSTLDQPALAVGSTTSVPIAQTPVAVAFDNAAAPITYAPAELALPTPALTGPAPATGAPVKRPRGRPPGSKGTPREVAKYRCRYGCKRPDMNGVNLRKHMMRVHGIFSSAHNIRKCAICERTYDPKIKDLICNKAGSFCPQLSDAERRNMNVQPPRDKQEEADTFAYDFSGPNKQGPSALVIVKPGDDEDERRAACAAAIENWPNATPGCAQVKHGLVTPDEMPMKASARASVELATGAESMTASTLPAYEGKGKKRAVEAPLQVAPAPKRAMHVVPVFEAPPTSQALPGAATKDTGLIEESNRTEILTFDSQIDMQAPLFTGMQAFTGPASSEIGLVEEHNRPDNLTFDSQAPYNNAEQDLDIEGLITFLYDQHQRDFTENVPDDVIGFD